MRLPRRVGPLAFAITTDACMPCKDVYVEKRVSNGIDPGIWMIDAVRWMNRVVQAGIQQRSWRHRGSRPPISIGMCLKGLLRVTRTSRRGSVRDGILGLRRPPREVVVDCDSTVADADQLCGAIYQHRPAESRIGSGYLVDFEPMCDIEVGFHSKLPCALALEAIPQGQVV